MPKILAITMGVGVAALLLFIGISWLISSGNGDDLYRLPIVQTFLAVGEDDADSLQRRLLEAFPADDELEAYDEGQKTASPDEIESLLAWSQAHGISIVAISLTPKQLFDSGLTDGGYAELETVRGISLIRPAFERLPQHIIDVFIDKTIYVSSAVSSPFIIIAGGNDQSKQLQNTEQGIVLPQPISQRQILKQVAFGIIFFGISTDQEQYEAFHNEKRSYETIFAVEDEASEDSVMSPLALTSREQNFAEHFVAYIDDGREFRRRSSENPKLAQKYIFFRDKLFRGQEF